MPEPCAPLVAASALDDDSVFVLVEPMRRTAPLVFASPHSGRRYPPAMMAAARASLACLRRSEDAYVDELFAAAATHGAPLLSATVARAFVDLNRAPDEIDGELFLDAPPPAQPPSPRVRAGLGVVPRVCGDGEAIYPRPLPFSEAERRLAAVHAPYHAKLSALMAETQAQFGCAVLIDCHSMPASARGAGQPDIVLGDRFGAACDSAVTALAEAVLKDLGYRVARNAPFAGGHITQLHGQPSRGIHALQVEVSRGLYMNERTLARGPGYARLQADMTRLIEALCAARFEARL